jgi:hypothetical protein
MRILEMMLPRLETMAELAGDRSVVRDPVRVAELREGYRYMANVCMSLLPDLEPALAELPPPCDGDAAIELKVAYQMSLIRQTNRLYRAVNATLEARETARQDRRRRASAGNQRATASS